MDLETFLKGTNTISLTTDFFEYLIKRAKAIDEIRAEIEKISIAPFATAYTAKHEALEIIDKYKSKYDDEGKQLANKALKEFLSEINGVESEDE